MFVLQYLTPLRAMLLGQSVRGVTLEVVEPVISAWSGTIRLDFDASHGSDRAVEGEERDLFVAKSVLERREA